jgi:two-component system response regulator PilR (NtrC family)
VQVSAGSRASVLIVDDEEVILDVLQTLLEGRGGYHVTLARSGQEAAAALESEPADLVLLDLFLPGEDGMSLLRRLRAEDPTREVIIMTAHGSVETAVEAMKNGAFHYLTKPFRHEEVMLLVETALTQRRLRLENIGLRRALAQRHSHGRIVGRSKRMQQVYRTIDQVAAARTTVLISGESGTGKELIAQAIHEQGPRPEAPFLTVNSSNLPPDLLESQLFGHVRGAFTGADAERRGLFEAAAGGTLFFDEISTIPPSVQAKLLRVLQEKEFLPLGAVETVKVDVRIIAASNQRLQDLVAAGQFREDLFYRLNVISLELPPLRDRREDIPPLVEHFLALLADEHGRAGLRLSPETLHALVHHSWPGNVRELRNVLERIVLLAPDEEIGPDLLPEEVRRTPAGVGQPDIPEGFSFQQAVEEFERSLIRRALERSDGVQRRAAELLGMKPTTLNERMKRLGIRSPGAPARR